MVLLGQALNELTDPPIMALLLPSNPACGCSGFQSRLAVLAGNLFTVVHDIA
jgi:hypothetical protein